MNFDTILSDIETIYQQNRGERLSPEASEEILRALVSVRDTEKILQSSARHLLQCVFESEDFYGKCVYPCDIVQLRRLFEKQSIDSLLKVVLFSNSCSEKIIKDQKIRIFLNISPEKLAKNNNCDVGVFGGMVIFDTNNLDIKGLINCVVVEGGGYEQIDVDRKSVV